MNAEAFTTYAAEHPEAVASYIEQGKKVGTSDARAQLKALIEAAAGNTSVAIDAFYAGQDAEQVKSIIAAIAKATADKDDAIKAQAAEIEKLKATIGTQSAVGTNGAAARTDDNNPPATDPKATATAEWASGKVNKDEWVDEDTYVRVRVKELATI